MQPLVQPLVLYLVAASSYALHSTCLIDAMLDLWYTLFHHTKYVSNTT